MQNYRCQWLHFGVDVESIEKEKSVFVHRFGTYFLSVCIYVFLFLETVDSIDGAGGWL